MMFAQTETGKRKTDDRTFTDSKKNPKIKLIRNAAFIIYFKTKVFVWVRID